jgi:serine/threonine-protein kinase
MDALGRAHDQGIIHRDLKPDNIFLRRDSSGAPVPVLLDFGMAQMVHAQWGHATQSGTLVGTPYYMSPEQAEGERELGPPADVWSIGVIWYRCLTGELPFTASTPTALLLAIVGRPAAPLRQRASDVPRELATVIDRSIRADLSERHADMKAFASELRAAAKQLGLSAPPGPTEPEGTDGLAVAPPLARPSTASSRRRLAAVAVLAAGVLGVAAWMVLGPLRADGAPSTADSGGEDRMAADPVAAASPPRNAEAADPPSGASSEPAATNAQGPKSATGTERPADGSARAASSKPASEARRSERTAPEAAGRSATSRLGGDEPAPESATSEGVRPKGVEAAGVGPEGAGSEDDGSELARAARREPEDARPGRDRSDEPQDAVPKRAAGGAGADPGGSTEDGSFGSGGLPEIETEW